MHDIFWLVTVTPMSALHRFWLSGGAEGEQNLGIYLSSTLEDAVGFSTLRAGSLRLRLFPGIETPTFNLKLQVTRMQPPGSESTHWDTLLVFRQKRRRLKGLYQITPILLAIECA
jgi:hypothetical protein